MLRAPLHLPAAHAFAHLSSVPFSLPLCFASILQHARALLAGMMSAAARHTLFEKNLISSHSLCYSLDKNRNKKKKKNILMSHHRFRRDMSAPFPHMLPAFVQRREKQLRQRRQQHVYFTSSALALPLICASPPRLRLVARRALYLPRPARAEGGRAHHVYGPCRFAFYTLTPHYMSTAAATPRAHAAEALTACAAGQIGSLCFRHDFSCAAAVPGIAARARRAAWRTKRCLTWLAALPALSTGRKRTWTRISCDGAATTAHHPWAPSSHIITATLYAIACTRVLTTRPARTYQDKTDGRTDDFHFSFGKIPLLGIAAAVTGRGRHLFLPCSVTRSFLLSSCLPVHHLLSRHQSCDLPPVSTLTFHHTTPYILSLSRSFHTLPCPHHAFISRVPLSSLSPGDVSPMSTFLVWLRACRWWWWAWHFAARDGVRRAFSSGTTIVRTVSCLLCLSLSLCTLFMVTAAGLLHTAHGTHLRSSWVSFLRNTHMMPS